MLDVTDESLDKGYSTTAVEGLGRTSEFSHLLVILFLLTNFCLDL